MKKMFLTCILTLALATPTLSHSVPAAAKLAFDVAMIGMNAFQTPSILRSWTAELPWEKRKRRLTFLHLGIYVYTIPRIYQAFKDMSSRGTISVKK